MSTINNKIIRELEKEATKILYLAGYASNGQPIKKVIKRYKERVEAEKRLGYKLPW